MRLSAVFNEIVELEIALGLKDISKTPGCWEHIVDEHWWFALNAHGETTQCSEGAQVPPFTAYVMFNGWPAAMISPDNGTVCAGAVANEDALIEALKAARKGLA